MIAAFESLDSRLRAKPPLSAFAGTTATNGLLAMLGAVSGILAARALGPTSRGDLAALLLWPQVLSSFGSLGIDLAATYFASERSYRRLVGTLMRIAGLQSLALGVVYLILVPVIFPQHLQPVAFAMALLIPVDLLAVYAAAFIAGELRFWAFNAVRLAMPIMYVVSLAALDAGGRITSASAAIAFLASNAVLMVFALVAVRQRLNLRGFDRHWARVALNYGLRAHVGRLSPQATGLDAAVIALALSPRALGYFVAANALLTLPRLFASAAGTLAFPIASTGVHRGQTASVRGLLAVATISAAGAAAFLWVFSQALVSLFFGHEFGPAADALRILAIAEVAHAARLVLREHLRGIGRPGLTTIAEIANWTLFLGAVGVALSFGTLRALAVAFCVAAFGSLAALVFIARRAGLLVPGQGQAIGAEG